MEVRLVGPTFLRLRFSSLSDLRNVFFFSNHSSMAISSSSSSICFNPTRFHTARHISSPSRLFPVTSFSLRSLRFSDRRSLLSSSASRLRLSPLCVRDSRGTYADLLSLIPSIFTSALRMINTCVVKFGND